MAMRLKIDKYLTVSVCVCPLTMVDNVLGFYRRVLCRIMFEERRIKVRGHAPCNDDPFPFQFPHTGKRCALYCMPGCLSRWVWAFNPWHSSTSLEGPLCSHTIVKLLQLQKPLYTSPWAAVVSADKFLLNSKTLYELMLIIY